MLLSSLINSNKRQLVVVLLRPGHPFLLPDDRTFAQMSAKLVRVCPFVCVCVFVLYEFN